VLRFIKEHIEYEERETELSKWEILLDKPELSISIKTCGKYFKSEVPYLRTQVILNGAFPLEFIIETVSSIF
jgi:hypothetical protein